MDCETCTDNLSAYLDGELSDDKTREMKAHLEICEPCSTEHKSLELSARFFETHCAERQVPSEIWHQVRSRVATMESPAPAPGLFSFLLSRPWWSAAATAVITALLVTGLWGYMQHQQAKRDLMQYMTQYIQIRDAQEEARRTAAAELETSSADSTHSEYMDNPFVTVDFVIDTNPFHSEDQ